jgi:hypothetical protein
MFDSPPVLIRPGRFGLSVIAERPIRWGEEIVRFVDCEIRPKGGSNTLQLSLYEHAYEPKVLAIVDHSCDPNTFVDVARRALIANQDIPAGTPLTRFYPSTEWALAQPFACLCGQEGCIGEVKGAKHMDPSVLFSRYVSCPIRELFHAQHGPGLRTDSPVLKTGTRELRRPALFQARDQHLRLVPTPDSLKARKNLLWE